MMMKMKCVNFIISYFLKVPRVSQRLHGADQEKKVSLPVPVSFNTEQISLAAEAKHTTTKSYAHYGRYRKFSCKNLSLFYLKDLLIHKSLPLYYLLTH